MDFKNILIKTVEKKELEKDEIKFILDLLLNNKIDLVDSIGFLAAFTTKGETTFEIEQIVKYIKKSAVKIRPKIKGNLIDTCGTGGDNIKTFNISTASAIIISACGCPVAKHGNRSISGICGSADFLESIGLDLDMKPEKITKSIEKNNFGFLFAPNFHPKLKNISEARKKLRIRTIFNIIGPLCNPCINLSNQIIGLYDKNLGKKLAPVMQNLGIETFLIYSDDGLDELSNTCKNTLIHVKNNEINKIRINPKNFGMVSSSSLEKIIIKSREESIKKTLQVIYGKSDRELEDIVVLNSGAALYLSKKVENMNDGIELSRQIIKSGAAKKQLEKIIQYGGNIDILKDTESKYKLN